MGGMISLTGEVCNFLFISGRNYSQTIRFCQTFFLITALIFIFVISGHAPVDSHICVTRQTNRLETGFYPPNSCCADCDSVVVLSQSSMIELIF